MRYKTGYRSRLSLLLLVSTIQACGLPYNDVGDPESLDSQSDGLIYPTNTQLWTRVGTQFTVPMCWHEFIGFRTAAEELAVMDFVRNTIQQGWADYLQMNVSWVNCPTTGTSRHVRTKLRVGDSSYNGFTSTTGMATLSSPADRAGGADPAGLRMGFPSNWNQNDATRNTFRGLILHEFGHILGFMHEQNRPDGNASLDACYATGPKISGVTLGPLDPTSIMGWGYCNSALQVLSRADIAAARQVYGVSNTHFGAALVRSDFFCLTGEECRIADVNGDGRDDIIAFYHRPDVAPVYVGLAGSDARFGAPQAWSSYFCTSGETCEVADVNGDGAADLVAFSRGSQPLVWVALSLARQGRSGFGPPQIWSNYACTNNEVCKLADVNGDRAADLVIFTHGSPPLVWVLTSRGGSFGAPQLWSSYFCTSTETCEVGDVNGDGRADLVAFARGSSPLVWVSTSTGAGITAPTIASNYFCTDNEVCAVADVDGDKRADLIAFTHNSTPRVWVGRASKSNLRFDPPQLWHSYFCTASEKCLVGNITGMGADVVAVTGSPGNRIWGALAEP